ncbi:MAG: pyruvate kinase [Candidatus Nomurabacteria bacterium]|jgi:pyruvate kinase|nr:pyruvate kinase [Candidatus Nomurabacteria bacterium]
MNGHKTKIVATIGATSGNGSREKLYEMIKAGMDAARINFSHAKYSEVEEQVKWIREISAELRQKVYLLADLAGPKIRLGELKDGQFRIKKGDELGLAFGVAHSGGPILPVKFDFSQYVSPRQRVFIFDGKIEAEVVAVVGKVVKIVAKTDGYVTSRNGINLPDTSFVGDALTGKDLKDLEFIKTQDFDWVGLSFVHGAEDISMLRKIIRTYPRPPKIVAKIETKAAIEPRNLTEIIKASDGAMVARGDMAYEIGAELVPIIQWRIVKSCHEHKKFSIIATQMLESMVESASPTRAEVSDVARAVFEGANYVMLSEETALGKYPVETVKEMDRITKTIIKNAKLGMK